MSDILYFTDVPKEPEWIVGPFVEHRVAIEGRVIPHLTATRTGDEVELVLDGRYGVTLPAVRAYQVAWLLAQALAIGSGYSHLGAETRERPFAPLTMRMDAPPRD